MPQHEGFQNAVNFTISLCLTYTLCIACVRIWIRKTAYGTDDLVIAIATLFTLGNTAASFALLSEGLGLPWSRLEQSSKLPGLNEASIFDIVTFTTALYLSKCAMLTFLSRITKTPKQLRLYRSSNVVVTLLGVVSVIIALVGCRAKDYYWAFYANKAACPNQSARWTAIAALDILTELLLLVLPVHLVWGLQMPTKKKAMIIVAFYLRVPVIGLAIGRTYYTLQLRLPQTDAGLSSALVIIMMDIELAYALAASTLSALKTFTESFNSGFGLRFTRGKTDSHDLSDVSGISGQSSKTEKSKDTVTSGSITVASRSCSLPSEALKHGIGGSGARPSTCQDNTFAPSGAADMLIMCETGYDVHHDELTTLPADVLVMRDVAERH